MRCNPRPFQLDQPRRTGTTDNATLIGNVDETMTTIAITDTAIIHTVTTDTVTTDTVTLPIIRPEVRPMCFLERFPNYSLLI